MRATGRPPSLALLIRRFAAAFRAEDAREGPRASLARAPAALVSLVLLALAGMQGCGGGDEAPAGEQARAVKEAREAFVKADLTPAELRRGPCVAERLPGLPNWVVDVAHDPRVAVDDLAQNQCRRYREGEAGHFVEVDPGGD